MSRAIRLALLSLAALALVNTSASAQRRGLVDVSPAHYRRGFWLEGGGGWGFESYKLAPADYTEALDKPTVFLRLGGTVNPHFRLGTEVAAWWYGYNDIDGYDVTEYLTEIMAIARFYPSKDLGLFFKGGAGLGISGVDGEFIDGTSEEGFASVLGGGYEIRVSKGVFITPAVDYYFNRFSKRDEPTLYERLWNISLGVTWQPGR
jgi:Outer membrane protein beta-barrel domain